MLVGLVLSPDRSNTSSLSKGCGEALSLVSGPFPGKEATLLTHDGEGMGGLPLAYGNTVPALPVFCP